MNKNSTLFAKIADVSVSVRVVFDYVDDSRIVIRVNNREDALLTCYCYRGQMSTIERAADGGLLVVVKK